MKNKNKSILTLLSRVYLSFNGRKQGHFVVWISKMYGTSNDSVLALILSFQLKM